MGKESVKGKYLFRYYKDKGLIDHYIEENEFTIPSILDYLFANEEDKEKVKPYIEDYINNLLKNPLPLIEIKKIDLNEGIVTYKPTELTKKLSLKI